MPSLHLRYYGDDCYYDNGYRYCNRSAWNDWVRWVVLVVIVLFFFGLFVICSKAGRQPYYGTGWAARPGNYGNAQPYYNNNYQQPAPPYTAQPQANQGYYGANQGYYGQQNGVELQSPQPTYHRGHESEYAPPAGPPPGKGDGIVR